MIKTLFAMRRFISIIIFIGTHITHAEPIISFFFRDYPSTNESCIIALNEKFKKPNCIAKRNLEGIMPHHQVAGIVATYFGFLQVSNLNGQMIFPRKQSSNSLSVLVTEKISPIILAHNTISHWKLVQGTPAAAYDFTLKEDPDTKLSYWDVREGTIPADEIINSLTTLIIIAKPTAIYIPLGITVAPHDVNLILPDVYVKKKALTRPTTHFTCSTSPIISAPSTCSIKNSLNRMRPSCRSDIYYPDGLTK